MGVERKFEGREKETLCTQLAGSGSAFLGLNFQKSRRQCLSPPCSTAQVMQCDTLCTHEHVFSTMSHSRCLAMVSNVMEKPEPSVRQDFGTLLLPFLLA